MQFHVPQYIDVEDKVFGKFSLAQVVYLAGGGGIGYMIWVKVFFPLNLLLAGSVIVFAAALAFFPEQKFGKPFIQIVEAAFNYVIRIKLYTWKRVPKKPIKIEELPDNVFAQSSTVIPNISKSKLKDMSWSVDVIEAEVESKKI